MNGPARRYARFSSHPRGDLFPEIGPFETGYLPLSAGHVMYWEQVGNPRGMPVLFLHGGPGAGAGAVHRRFFDPTFWRLVVFDQRGAGRSRPLGALAHNTTQDLVRDIETLRRHLDIPRWLLFGGSWGSTLALAYAAGGAGAGGRLRAARRVPRPRAGSGVVPARHGGLLPGPPHAAFVSFLPEAERDDILGAYLRRLTDPDPTVHLPAARAWSVYEGSCSTLLPSPDTVNSFAQDRSALGLARIEAHYFAHALFLPPGGLLARMDRLAGIPAEIVQGRYDMICPPRTAFDLAAALADRAPLHRAGRRAFGAGARHTARPCRGRRAVPQRPLRQRPARCRVLPANPTPLPSSLPGDPAWSAFIEARRSPSACSAAARPPTTPRSACSRPRRHRPARRCRPATRRSSNAAAQLGIATVTFSQLARTEASRASTRDLATRLAASHTTINQDLDKLAKGGRVAPDLTLDATHQLAYTRLEALRGRAFDRAYLDQLATDHAAMLTLFRDEAASGTEPNAKQLAVRTPAGARTARGHDPDAGRQGGTRRTVRLPSPAPAGAMVPVRRPATGGGATAPAGSASARRC